MDSNALTYAGYKGFVKNIFKISKREFDKATKYLIKNHFIEVVRKTKTRIYYRLFIPPLYDGKQLLPMYPKHCMRTDDLYELKHGFIRLPRNFIAYLKSKVDLETGISLKEILLLLKLYSYCFPEVYGGVCHSIIHDRRDGKLIYEDFLYEDVRMTAQQMVQALKKLEELGFLRWKKVIINKENVNGISQYQYLKNYVGGAVKRGHEVVKIISLTYPPPPMRITKRPPMRK